MINKNNIILYALIALLIVANIVNFLGKYNDDKELIQERQERAISEKKLKEEIYIRLDQKLDSSNKVLIKDLKAKKKVDEKLETKYRNSKSSIRSLPKPE